MLMVYAILRILLHPKWILGSMFELRVFLQALQSLGRDLGPQTWTAVVLGRGSTRGL